MPPEIKAVTKDVELGAKDAKAKVELYNDKWYLSLRYMYQDRNTGEMKYAKNGINVPIEDATDAIKALVDVYYDATGEDWQAHFEG